MSIPPESVVRAVHEALAASFLSSRSLEVRHHSPMLDRPLTSFSIRHPDQVRNRRGRRRRRVTEVARQAGCPEFPPDPPGLGKSEALVHSYTPVHLRGGCVQPFFFKAAWQWRSLHCLFLHSPCDVLVAILPARGVGLCKILGLPMDNLKLDPRIFKSGVGSVRSFCCRHWCECC